MQPAGHSSPASFAALCSWSGAVLIHPCPIEPLCTRDSRLLPHVWWPAPEGRGLPCQVQFGPVPEPDDLVPSHQTLVNYGHPCLLVGESLFWPESIQDSESVFQPYQPITAVVVVPLS